MRSNGGAAYPVDDCHADSALKPMESMGREIYEERMQLERSSEGIVRCKMDVASRLPRLKVEFLEEAPQKFPFGRRIVRKVPNQCQRARRSGTTSSSTPDALRASGLRGASWPVLGAAGHMFRYEYREYAMSPSADRLRVTGGTAHRGEDASGQPLSP